MYKNTLDNKQFKSELETSHPDSQQETLPEPIIPLKRVWVMTGVGWLNIRAQPSSAAEDLGDLPNGSVIPVVDIYGDFYRIDGWIHKDCVKDV